MRSLRVGKSQELYNAQKVEDVGKSECLCVMQRIRVKICPVRKEADFQRVSIA